MSLEKEVDYMENSSYCYTGSFGSKETDCLIEEGENRVLFTANNQLNSNEGMTIVLSFPKGEIYQPSFWENIGLFIIDNWGLFLPIIVFGLMFFLWLKKGKDEPFKKTLIAQYEVPDELTPGEMGYLMKERYTGRFLAGDIVNLAVKGYLKIEEAKEINLPKLFLKIKKYKKAFSVLIILSILFFFLDSFKSLELNSTSANLLIKSIFTIFFGSLILFFIFKVINFKAKKREYKFEKLKDWENSKNLTEHEKNILKGIFKSKKIGSKISLKERKDFYQDKKRIDEKIKEQIEKRNYFQKELLNNIFVYIALAVVVFVFGFFGMLFLDRLDIFLGSLISIGIIVLFGNFMSKKTSKGSEAFWKSKGFKRYIDVAENDRAKFYAKENMFEKVLPYAIVFGNVNKWAKAFDGIIKEPPEWYSGTRAFSVVAFSNSLNTSLVDSSNSASASPSSSGSGGGGSSGGGGGGGGGGSW